MRIVVAQRAVASLDDTARVAAEELLAAVEEHHTAVLKVLVNSAAGGRPGRQILFAAVDDDPEVYAALVKAGITRPSLAMERGRWLDGGRPDLAGHGAYVELIRIEAGVAYVRLLGARRSMRFGDETLRDSVAEALLDHLPEITAVQEETAGPAGPSAFIPLSSLTVGRGGR